MMMDNSIFQKLKNDGVPGATFHSDNFTFSLFFHYFAGDISCD